MQNLGQSAFLKNRKDGAKKIDIKIPSEIRRIRGVSSKILGYLGPYNAAEAKIFDIRLCIEEAVRNAIVHGNKSDKRRYVKISYWAQDDKLNIVVEDEGGGFDYKNLPDPTIEGNMLKNSGRGVHIILKLMDSVEFNESGSRIWMIKNIK